MNPDWMHGRPCYGWDLPGYGRNGVEGPNSWGADPGYQQNYEKAYYEPTMNMAGSYDPSYGAGDDFGMEDPNEIELRRRRQTAAMDERMADPNRFWFARANITPSPQREIYGYAPGVGEPEYPDLMDRHMREFAYGRETPIPFQRDGGRYDAFGSTQHRSTLPPTGMTAFETGAWQDGAVNRGSSLYGAFDQDFVQQPSLLTEPVSNNRQRIGYPEGAIDYVGNIWGMNELDVERDSYRRIGNNQLTDLYVNHRNAGLDPPIPEPPISEDSPWSMSSGSWMSYDPNESYSPYTPQMDYYDLLWPYETTGY